MYLRNHSDQSDQHGIPQNHGQSHEQDVLAIAAIRSSNALDTRMPGMIGYQRQSRFEEACTTSTDGSTCSPPRHADSCLFLRCISDALHTCSDTDSEGPRLINRQSSQQISETEKSRKSHLGCCHRRPRRVVEGPSGVVWWSEQKD